MAQKYILNLYMPGYFAKFVTFDQLSVLSGLVLPFRLHLLVNLNEVKLTGSSVHGC